MTAMAVLFGLFAILGLLVIALDIAAMSNDPTPSQYSMGLSMWGTIIFIVCGLIALASLADS